MKIKLFLITLVFLSLFGLVNSIKAETTTTANQQNTNDKLKKFGVVFPIVELGNCADFISCRTFCADTVNIDACKAYGRKKGFYNEQEEINKKRMLLQRAKLELKCSEETCKNFCEQKENSVRCKNFILKYKPETERVKTKINQEMVVKAKLLLGCTTPEACKTLCEQENNKQKCSDFFRQLGLRKEKKVEETELRKISPLPVKLDREIITITKSPIKNVEVKGVSTEQNLFVILFQKILDLIE